MTVSSRLLSSESVIPCEVEVIVDSLPTQPASIRLPVCARFLSVLIVHCFTDPKERKTYSNS